MHDVGHRPDAGHRLGPSLGGRQVGDHVRAAQVDRHHAMTVVAQHPGRGGPDSRGGSGDDVRPLALTHGDHRTDEGQLAIFGPWKVEV